MQLSLIELDRPGTAAGVFTRNAVTGAPVQLCRGRVGRNKIRGVLVNNKVANVCAPGGLESARRIASRLAELSGDEDESWLYASTGVIGWRIPEGEISAGLPELRDGLTDQKAVEFARGIMTTDRYPKIRTIEVGGARITGIVKGAGMIEPNMATMLAFLLTDADLPAAVLQRSLDTAVQDSFNALSVDGDQSTSDMALLLSSGEAGAVDAELFTEALTQLTMELARDLVRNGEGTAHVMQIKVEGARTKAEARGFGKAVANSPLVKTAVYGNDPNVGRILSAIGDYAGNSGIPLNLDRLKLSLGGHQVFSSGEFRLDPSLERRLSDYLQDCSFSSEQKGFPEHDEMVEIGIDLSDGDGAALVWGSDFSYEYIRENAEYRS